MAEMAALLVRTQRTRFTLSKILSQTGSGIRYVTVLYLIYHLDRSSLAIGVTLGIPSVAQILLAPLGGLVADRMHRPRLIAFLYGLSGLSLCLLWAVTQMREFSPPVLIPLVYILYAITATADTLVGPGYRTLMTEWVSEGALVRWEGLLNALTQGFWLGGVLITGLSIAVMGPDKWLLVSACLVLAASLMMIRQFEPHRFSSVSKTPAPRLLPAIQRAFGSLVLAWKQLRAHPFMWAFAVLIGLSNIPHNLLLSLPFFLAMGLHQGYGGFSVLEAFVVLGAIAGNVWIARRVTGHHIRMLMVLAFTTQSIICLILWITTASSFVAVVSLFAVYGSTDALFTPAYAHLSTVAPQAVRGQVFGLFNVIALLATPICNVGLGWLLTITSSAPIILGLSVAFGVLALFTLRSAAFQYETPQE
jgi:MFS family permease